LTIPLYALKRIEKIRPMIAILKTLGRKKMIRKKELPFTYYFTNTAKTIAIGISVISFAIESRNVLYNVNQKVGSRVKARLKFSRPIKIGIEYPS
jgi:hypothetical protein